MSVTPPGGGEPLRQPKSVSESHLAHQVLSTGPELVANVLGGLPWYAAIPLIGPYFAKLAACRKIRKEIIAANNQATPSYNEEQLKRFLAPLSIDHLVLFQELPHLDNLTDFNRILQGGKGKSIGEIRRILLENRDRLDAIMRMQADEESPPTVSETFAAFLKVHEPLRAIEDDVARMLSTYTPRGFDTFVAGWVQFAAVSTEEEVGKALGQMKEYMKTLKAIRKNPSDLAQDDAMKLLLVGAQLQETFGALYQKLGPTFRVFSDFACPDNTQIADENIRTLIPETLNTEREFYQMTPMTRLGSTSLALFNQNQPLGDIANMPKDDHGRVNLHGLKTEIHFINPHTGESRCAQLPLPFEAEAMSVAEAKTIASEISKQVKVGSQRQTGEERYRVFTEGLEKAVRAAQNDFFADSYFAHAKDNLPQDPRKAIAQYNIYRLDDGRLSLLPQGVDSKELVTSISSEDLQALKEGKEVEIPGLGPITVAFQEDLEHPIRHKMVTTVNGVSRISHHSTQHTIEDIVASPFFERDILLGIAHYYAAGNG